MGLKRRASERAVGREGGSWREREGGGRRKRGGLRGRGRRVAAGWGSAGMRMRRAGWGEKDSELVS